jgi:hypothetical protein
MDTESREYDEKIEEMEEIRDILDEGREIGAKTQLNCTLMLDINNHAPDFYGISDGARKRIIIDNDNYLKTFEEGVPGLEISEREGIRVLEMKTDDPALVCAIGNGIIGKVNEFFRSETGYQLNLPVRNDCVDYHRLTGEYTDVIEDPAFDGGGVDGVEKWRVYNLDDKNLTGSYEQNGFLGTGLEFYRRENDEAWTIKLSLASMKLDENATVSVRDYYYANFADAVLLSKVTDSESRRHVDKMPVSHNKNIRAADAYERYYANEEKTEEEQKEDLKYIKTIGDMVRKILQLRAEREERQRKFSGKLAKEFEEEKREKELHAEASGSNLEQENAA